MKPSLSASRKAKICSGCGMPPAGGGGGASCAITAGDMMNAAKTTNDLCMDLPSLDETFLWSA
jgi:hypothetical protein